MTPVRRSAIVVILIAAGILGIIAGIVRGEHLVVLNKAILICLECIGIG